tara:strand:+ start:1187 stop:2695 length:1509 start_codon:yes stop_codon:yes gene_type:complete
MRILRSIIPEPRIGDDEKAMLQNYTALRESILKFDLPTDRSIYEYIKDFVSQHSHLPTQETAINFLDSNNQYDEADRIRSLSTIEPAYRGDFIFLIEKQVEEARVMALSETMAQVKEITRNGIEIKEGRTKRKLKGARDAGRFISQQLHDLMTPTFGSRIGGEALGDGDEFWEEYQKIKDTKVEILPKTGLQVIDDAIGGFKRKELYIMAGFTGHMKSKSAVNWVYNQSVFGGTSTVYFSLEMHYSQCRRTIYAFHSMHPKFRKKRLALGIQSHPNPDVGLDPIKIRDGKLTKDEELFLREVIDDLKTNMKNGTYGSIFFEVADPDSLDFTVEDMRTKAETIASKHPVKLVVVDHALLMSARRWVASTTERLNEVIRDLKKTAMGFNRGQGIPILCLFQINREGFKAAEKNDGTYNLTHLSYANEAERSADVVIASWYDDNMRQKNMIKYQCLKSRDQAPFEAFEAQTAWPVGRILNTPMNFKMGASPKAKAKKEDPLEDVV